VYQCQRGTDVIRVVVVRQLPEAAHNAPLYLFSGSEAQVAYGARHYRQRSEDTSTLLQQLFQGYEREGLAMPYTMEDFRRDYAKEHFKDLTPEEQREAIKGLPPERQQEALRGLPPEVRLEGLSVEEIEQFLKKRKPGGSARQGKSRRRK
jgi:hypothetical protein